MLFWTDTALCHSLDRMMSLSHVFISALSHIQKWICRREVFSYLGVVHWRARDDSMISPPQPDVSSMLPSCSAPQRSYKCTDPD